MKAVTIEEANVLYGNLLTVYRTLTVKYHYKLQELKKNDKTPRYFTTDYA